jgi:excisionase family DNA binding protein
MMDNNNQSNETLLLTPMQAAKALTVSQRTLWQLKTDGKIRCIRINRLVRYDPKDLLAYIERQKKFSESQK